MFMMDYVLSKRTGDNGYISDNSKEDDEYSLEDLNELEWCKFCAHYGWVENYNACGDGNWFQILRNGPLSVSYCGWCRHFVNKYSPEGRAIQYSKFKQKLLAGMGFQQKREK